MRPEEMEIGSHTGAHPLPDRRQYPYLIRQYPYLIEHYLYLIEHYLYLIRHKTILEKILKI